MAGLARDARGPVGDALPLAAPAGAPEALLLTTCAASDGPEQAGERLARFPSAVAEDMEGFAVALACALAAVPLTIVRGISNRVGDRRTREWRITEAMRAAGELARVLLAREGSAT